VAAFAEGELCIVHAPTASSYLKLGRCVSNRATSSHQFVDEFLTEVGSLAGCQLEEILV